MLHPESLVRFWRTQCLNVLFLFRRLFTLYKTSVTPDTSTQYINFNTGNWKFFKTTLSRGGKKFPHLTNSFSSRCLVNYSRPLNNWGARKYESFNDAAACIRARRFSDTSWWGNGSRRTQPSHVRFNTVLVFINKLLENFLCAVFSFS